MAEINNNELTDIQKKSDNSPRYIPRQSMSDWATPKLFVKHFTSCNGSRMIEISHRYDYYVMAILIQGEVVLSIDFNELVLTPGYALVIQPSQVHSCVSASDDAEGWMLGLSPNILRRVNRK